MGRKRVKWVVKFGDTEKEIDQDGLVQHLTDHSKLAPLTAYQYSAALKRLTNHADIADPDFFVKAKRDNLRTYGLAMTSWGAFMSFLAVDVNGEDSPPSPAVSAVLTQHTANLAKEKAEIDGRPFLYYKALYYIRNLTPKQNVSPGTCPQANIKWFCNSRSTHRLRWCDMTALRSDGKTIGISLNLPPSHEMGMARSWTEIPIPDLFYAYRYLLLWAWNGERLAPDDPRMQGSVVPAEPGETEPMSPTEFETRLRRFPAREPEHARKVRELWDRYSTHVREQSGFTGL